MACSMVRPDCGSHSMAPDMAMTATGPATNINPVNARKSANKYLIIVRA